MYSTKDLTYDMVLDPKGTYTRMVDRQLYPYIGQDVVVTPRQLGISGLGNLGSLGSVAGFDTTSLLIGVVLGALLLWYLNKQGVLQ